MKQIVKSVAIVTIFGIITKALGLLIKIYISREIGAESLGIYQIALSAFFLLCALVSSGIPLVISRKVANNKQTESSLVSSGLVVAIFVCVIIGITLILFPDLFYYIWKQKASVIVLLVLLPALVGTAIYTPFRGAFWGRKDFFTLSFVELIEQIIRFIVCIIIFNVGIIAIAGEILAGLSVSIACVLSTIFAVVVYFRNKGKLSTDFKEIKSLIKESTPIAVVKIVTNLITMFIAIILPARLVSSGQSLSNSIADFGIVSGMVLPLLTIPGTIIGSIAIILIPELGALTGKSSNDLKSRINSSLSVSILLSLFLFPIFLSLGTHIGLWLYEDNLAGDLIKFGSYLLLPLGISQITTSILNALGYEKKSLINYSIGTIFLLLSIFILPKYIGIYSLLVAMLGMSIITSILNLFIMKKYLNFVPLKTFLATAGICIPCALVTYFINNVLLNYFSKFISVSISSTVSIICFGILCLCFNLFDITAIFPERFKNKKLKKKQV